MKTTIIEKQKWMDYCGIAGMTATEWLRQVLGYRRETDIRHVDVMYGLRIGGWSHAMHYNGNCGFENTTHAHNTLLEEVQRLASELDKRLHELTAVENELCEMIKEQNLTETSSQ